MLNYCREIAMSCTWNVPWKKNTPIQLHNSFKTYM